MDNTLNIQVYFWLKELEVIKQGVELEMVEYYLQEKLLSIWLKDCLKGIGGTNVIVSEYPP